METLLINLEFVVITWWIHWWSLVSCDCGSVLVQCSLVVPKLGSPLRTPEELRQSASAPWWSGVTCESWEAPQVIAGFCKSWEPLVQPNLPPALGGGWRENQTSSGRSAAGKVPCWEMLQGAAWWCAASGDVSRGTVEAVLAEWLLSFFSFGHLLDKF